MRDTRLCASIVIVGLFVGSCAPGPPDSQELQEKLLQELRRELQDELQVFRQGEEGDEGATQIQTVSAQNYGPDVILKPETEGTVDIWAQIDATDPKGISIHGVMKDDTLKVLSISGVAWFEDQSGLRMVCGIRLPSCAIPVILAA